MFFPRRNRFCIGTHAPPGPSCSDFARNFHSSLPSAPRLQTRCRNRDLPGHHKTFALLLGVAELGNGDVIVLSAQTQRWQATLLRPAALRELCITLLKRINLYIFVRVSFHVLERVRFHVAKGFTVSCAPSALAPATAPPAAAISEVPAESPKTFQPPTRFPLCIVHKNIRIIKLSVHYSRRTGALFDC